VVQDAKNQNNVQFELLHMAPEFTNSVLAFRGTDCVIFDSWGRADDWLRLLRGRNLQLKAIYSTHGHPDHIAAAPDLVFATGCRWFLHKSDFNLLGWGNDILTDFGLKPLTRGVVPDALPNGRVMVFPGVTMDVIPMPGHTPGGVAFYFSDFGICLVGDTIFADSIGRTDLPGGDIYRLKQSVSEFYHLNLPNYTTVIPGHDKITTVGQLKEDNPWVKSLELGKAR